MRVVLIFSMILLVLMCGAVCRVLAKAPTTPKILFTSARDGNYEIYMMNPDGSEQVNLTQHRADDQASRQLAPSDESRVMNRNQCPLAEMMAFELFRRSRYESGVIFSMILLVLMCGAMSGFSQSADNAENPVYLRTGWQLRNLHDESGWLRTGEPDTASRR